MIPKTKKSTWFVYVDARNKGMVSNKTKKRKIDKKVEERRTEISTEKRNR